MKPRSRAGGKASKARGRETVRPKRPNAPNDVARHVSSAAGADGEVVRLTRELNDALELQTATSEVLQLISSFSGDLEPVFATILGNAARICDAKFGNIFRWDGDALCLVATHNTPPAFAEYRKSRPLPLKLNLPFSRMVATKAVVHCADAAALPAYTEQRDLDVVAAVELGGIRTFVAVPMLKENKLIGALIVYRQEVRPFTDKQIELVKNFAAQAVIAIENMRLLNELRQRTSDLTERTADLTEALDQQTATSEVLQVISSSPGDLEPVFQAMLENATRICEAKFGVVFSFDGNEFHFEAQVGTPPELAEYIRARPMPQPLAGSHLDRLRQTKRVSYTADYAAEGIPAPPVTLGGARSTVDVPMLKDDELVGAFSIYRQEVRPFTDKQIDLVKNFAAKPLSPSRTRDCLMNSDNHLSSRQLPLTCFRSSAVLPVILNQCLRLCWRRPRVFATPRLEISFDGMAKRFTSWRRTRHRLHSRRHIGSLLFIPVRQAISVVW
jgi:GAF domain-containing protein